MSNRKVSHQLLDIASKLDLLAMFAEECAYTHTSAKPAEVFYSWFKEKMYAIEKEAYMLYIEESVRF